MPASNRKSETSLATLDGLPAQWPLTLVTLLIGTMAVGLVWPQIFPGSGQDNEATLPNLDRRVAMLRQVDDPIRRDSFNGGFNSFARQLDRTLPRDARIFVSGMLGRKNASQVGYYYVLRNYLFPRTVAISLDGKPVLQEGWFEGIPCDSPSELRTNGFDLLLMFSTNNTVRIVPLTQKGVPK
jgi:hypothetical protein